MDLFLFFLGIIIFLRGTSNKQHLKVEENMKQNGNTPYLFYALVLILTALFVMPTFGIHKAYSYKTSPPFSLSKLKPVGIPGPRGKMITAYEPLHPYEIMINYELGMHCVGFDMSYCCVIPPYNSIQAQAFRTGENGLKPKMLSPKNGVKLQYYVRNNSYSEGNKMAFWSVWKHVKGDAPGASGNDYANYVWDHLFIYKDLNGTIPKNWTRSERLYVGKDLQVPIDSGPSGKHLSGGYLDYWGSHGGNIVFTDSMIPAVPNVPLTLTSSYMWDALGLPLTAFNDGVIKGGMQNITNYDFQPFQYSTVVLHKKNGQTVKVNGKPVIFFGTNPVDMPNCYLCHSGNGTAAMLSKERGLTLFQKEYAYWRHTYPHGSVFMARLKSASIDILELHDSKFGTHFLSHYNPNASTNRLGVNGPVNCADCHGDNVSGNLQEPRPEATGYKATKALPLTVAIHVAHLKLVPMPDAAGRTQSCQACHPTHWWRRSMNNFNTNPFSVVNNLGTPNFTKADVRTSGGGCYLRRDAHSNPNVSPPFFLNSVGKWYFNNVSTRNAEGQKIPQIRGLYCTDCHNELSQKLYDYDNFSNAVTQSGKTLRNKSISEIINVIADGNAGKFKNYYADPKVGAAGNPLVSFYKDHGAGATLVRAMKNSAGQLELLAWNAKEGGPVPYGAAAAGSDWWLAPSEPHCANCHEAPFVESQGGKYFPIDQPAKYSLYRYSKSHANIACQTCHESIHGLYPVRYAGPSGTLAPDMTTHQQAIQFSPDGSYAGPVTCAACHTVNAKGVPVQLKGTRYFNDYWASVTLIHFMRGKDYNLSISALMKKYPYSRSREIVIRGWK